MLISFFSLFLLLLSLPLSPNFSSAHPATKLLFSFWSRKFFLPACRHGLWCCWLPKQPSRALGIQVCPATGRPFCFLTRDIALTVGVVPRRTVGVHPSSPSSRRISAAFPLLKPLRLEGIYFRRLKGPLYFGLHGCCCRARRLLSQPTVHP